MAGVVKAALIGAGGYAKANVIPFIPLYKNLEFVAVCDTDLATARGAARKIGAKTVTADYGEILARDDIQMVELQTPNYLHAEQAVAAFGAGKHVFSQKPMARTMAEARQMIEAGQKAGRQLGVYMDGFDDPFLWDMKAAIRAGLLGKIVNFRFRYAHQGGLALAGEAWRRSTARTGGGSFLLLTVHLTNAVAWLLDTRITRVAGFMKTQMAPMEGDDTTAGAVELETGQIGAAEACYIAAGSLDIPNTVLEIRGTEGAMRHQRDDGILYVYAKSGKFEGPSFHYDKPGKTMKFRRSMKSKHRPTVHERFADAILGGEPYVCPGEVGMRDLAVALAMAEASKDGHAVSVDEYMKK
jgi:predicted dehydrogenase